MARASYFLERLGLNVYSIPISFYRKASFYNMKTDSLDRFDIKLEKRFTKSEILEMMVESGLKNTKFRENTPFWITVGTKI